MTKLSEEDEPEGRPEYLSNPVIREYIHRLFHLADDLVTESESREHPLAVYQLRDILTTIFYRIETEGEMEELDAILRLHFPSYYGPEDSDSLPDLVGVCMTTNN